MADHSEQVPANALRKYMNDLEEKTENEPPSPDNPLMAMRLLHHALDKNIDKAALMEFEESQKRIKQHKDTLHMLMYGDLRNEMDAVTFRKLMNSSNPDNYLVDLTFGLINIAIEQGHNPPEEPVPGDDSNPLSHSNSPSEKSPGLLPVKRLGKGVCKPSLGYDFSKISCLRELK